MQDPCYRQDVFDAYCTTNNLDGVELLLKQYRDDPFIRWKNREGVNCIALAAMDGHDKMIQFLHEKGGDINNANSRGRTPLMEAALWWWLEVVKFLLEHGADPRAKDFKGHDAYFLLDTKADSEDAIYIQPPPRGGCRRARSQAYCSQARGL